MIDQKDTRRFGYFEATAPLEQRLAPVSCVNFPRSGHHLLAHMLRLILGDRFGYCEFYTPKVTVGVPCCGAFPCRKTAVITMAKNHDFDSASPVPDGPVIVQHREFAGAVTSAYELWTREPKNEDSAAAFRAFAEERARRYARFRHKWVLSDISRRHIVDYADLTAEPEAALLAVLDFMGAGDVDASVVRDAVQSSPDISGPRGQSVVKPKAGVRARRDATAFRYYDEALFADLSAMAYGDPHPVPEPAGR